ncbi:hypothetical protein V6S63_02145 [Lactococcus lactis]|uniref:Uncharacterized protein n=1 Tax=Lactococcus lactis subsp. lactis TaxID=1360 RepID=A0A0V8EDE8_LACLL|nr:hypothetical protein [Lactococcus lactis]KSU23888.1 hypothetical protein N42_2705 [Lactococcus lactis subsp. lactis]MDU0409800.1 hypothetical protein [Lactococcus lactis]
MYKIEMSVDSLEKVLDVVDNLSQCKFSLSVDVYHLPKKEKSWTFELLPCLVIPDELRDLLFNLNQNSN